MANDKVKKEIEERLHKIVEFQKEIENIVARALEELRKISILSQKKEKFQEIPDEQVAKMEEPEAEITSEEAPEIEIEIPERDVPGGIRADFEEELTKVKKIKDILEKPEISEKEIKFGEEKREKPEEPERIEGIEFETPERMETAEAPPTEKEIEEAIGEEPPLEKPVEEPIEEKIETEVGQELEIKESDTMQTMFSGRWKKHWQEKPQAVEEEMTGTREAETVETAGPGEGEALKFETRPEVEKEPEIPVSGTEVPPIGRRATDAEEILEGYKKIEPPEESGEVCYYEHEEKQIVDSNCLVQSMIRHLEEGKNLYIKLSQTESPKDQFFVKQEIIQHQEALRSVVEIISRMLEKETCSLPEYTKDVINSKTIKEILENLSMQNWSNQDDFTFFDEYAKKVKSDYGAKVTSRVDYLKSIIEELGVF